MSRLAICDFNENFFTGLWTSNITKLTMENCHCDDTLSTNWVVLDFQTAFGAAVTGQSADVLINNATFNRNSSSGFAFRI